MGNAVYWVYLLGFVTGSFMMGLVIGLTKDRTWTAIHKLCFVWGLFTWLFNGTVLAYSLGLV